MTLNITRDKAIELTVAVIEREGADKVYQKHGGSCLYVHSDAVWNDETNRREVTNEAPGCLVGHALLEGGLEFADLVEVNQIDAQAALYELQKDGVLTYTYDAAEYFNSVQLSQDRGKTWGESHDHALVGEVWQGESPHLGKSSGWVPYEEYNNF